MSPAYGGTGHLLRRHWLRPEAALVFSAEPRQPDPKKVIEETAASIDDINPEFLGKLLLQSHFWEPVLHARCQIMKQTPERLL